MARSKSAYVVTPRGARVISREDRRYDIEAPWDMLNFLRREGPMTKEQLFSRLEREWYAEDVGAVPVSRVDLEKWFRLLKKERWVRLVR